MDIKYIKDHSSNTEFYPATHIDAVVGLKNVAKTGSYNDLTDTPTIPDEYDDTELSGRVSTIEGKESGWNAKYDKPSGGIPSSDLSSAVLASLGKADTALLSFTETDPTVPDWAKAATKPSYSYSEITDKPTIPDAVTISTSGSFVLNGLTYSLTNSGGDIRLSALSNVSIAFADTTKSGSDVNLVKGSTSSSKTATATPSNKVTITVLYGSETIKLKKVEFTKGDSTTEKTLTDTFSADGTKDITLDRTDDAYATAKSKSGTLTPGSSITTDSTEAQSVTLYYTKDDSTTEETVTASVASATHTINGVEVRRAYKKTEGGSWSQANTSDYTSRPSSLKFTNASGVNYFTFPSTWGTPTFKYSLGTDDSWAVLDDETIDTLTYKVYKHSAAGQYEWTVSFTGGTAL